jgi:hypothetical protein
MNLPPNTDPGTAYSYNDVAHWPTNDTRDKRRFIDNIFAELCVRLQPTRDVGSLAVIECASRCCSRISSVFSGSAGCA